MNTNKKVIEVFLMRDLQNARLDIVVKTYITGRLVLYTKYLYNAYLAVKKYFILSTRYYTTLHM